MKSKITEELRAAYAVYSTAHPLELRNKRERLEDAREIIQLMYNTSAADVVRALHMAYQWGWGMYSFLDALLLAIDCDSMDGDVDTMNKYCYLYSRTHNVRRSANERI